MIQMDLFTKQKKKLTALKNKLMAVGWGCRENEGKGQ